MHKMIGVKELTPSPNNNRTTFDLDSLSASIKEVGIIEPLDQSGTDPMVIFQSGDVAMESLKADFTIESLWSVL